MTIVTRTLIVSSVLFLMFSINIPDEISSNVIFLREASARFGRPVTPLSVAGVARRTTRRAVIGTTAVVNSTTSQDSQQVVVVDQAPQDTPQSGAAVPIGTTITALPGGCSSLSIQGGTYFNCDGVYYQPSYQGTTLVYVVVPAP